MEINGFIKLYINIQKLYLTRGYFWRIQQENFINTHIVKIIDDRVLTELEKRILCSDLMLGEIEPYFLCYVRIICSDEHNLRVAYKF